MVKAFEGGEDVLYPQWVSFPLGDALRSLCGPVLPVNHIFRRSTRKGTIKRELDQNVSGAEREREALLTPCEAATAASLLSINWVPRN
jgi:hypothetical protein